MGDWQPDDIALAEQAQADLGQDSLFVIWPWDAALDAALAAQGYAKIDPVMGYAAPLSAFAPPQRMRSFPHWPPCKSPAKSGPRGTSLLNAWP